MLCGRPAVTRRIDLTDSEVSRASVYDYEVRGVLRGVLLCSACIVEQPIGRLLSARTGIELVRGCMVQCADRPPWHLRWVLPGGARVWRKTVCPCCKGRATIQIIAEAVERPESALWRALRDAFALLSLRRPDDDDDDGQDDEAAPADREHTLIIGGGDSDDGQ